MCVRARGRQYAVAKFAASVANYKMLLSTPTNSIGVVGFYFLFSLHACMALA